MKPGSMVLLVFSGASGFLCVIAGDWGFVLAVPFAVFFLALVLSVLDCREVIGKIMAILKAGGTFLLCGIVANFFRWISN